MEKQSIDILDIEKIRNVVTQLLPSGQPALESTAEILHISPRTLQRRLAELGMTYTQLVDEVRFVMARNLIIQHKKFSDVATQLGYADAGSFTRAFERWTGMTPQHYRKSFTNRPNASHKQPTR